MKVSRKRFSSTLNPQNYSSIWIALCATLVPHFFYQPWLLSVLMASILIYWLLMLRNSVAYKKIQNKKMQYAVVLIGCVVIFVHYQTFLGIEAGCALLGLIFLAKAFEVKNYRDAIIEMNFALFVVASLFLYGQSILMAIAAIIAVFCCFFAMYQLQCFDNTYQEVDNLNVTTQQQLSKALKVVCGLLLLAVPFMLVLFVFFPRFSPLWSIPVSNQQATTGISDQLSLGDIAHLSQSNALAFRVIFSDMTQLPEKSKLYWRAMALEHFDGVHWTQSFYAKHGYAIEGLETGALPAWYQPSTQKTEKIPYQILLEPTFQPWIFALDFSLAASPIHIHNDLSLQTPFINSRRRQFDVHWLKSQIIVNPILSEQSRAINLQLPKEANPLSQKFAHQMFIQAGQQPRLYIESILTWIGVQNFTGTYLPTMDICVRF